MRRAFLRYNLLLALLIAPVTIVLTVTSFMLQPLVGNMTRLGGYSENDYGWNMPQHYFREPLFTHESGPYQRYSDVVVLGDSFSENPRWGWPAFFVNETGMSLQFFHYNQGDIERIVDSPLFRAEPPKLLIVESVENLLKPRFGRDATVCDAAISDLAEPISTVPLNVETFELHRETTIIPFNLDQAADFLGKALPRLVGLNYTDTMQVELSRGDLFSSRISGVLLAYNDDLEIRGWGSELRQRIRCKLQQVQNQVQRNGRTHFLFMPVPAKLYAYADFVVHGEFHDLTLAPMLDSAEGLQVLRLGSFVRERVAAGAVDFYLPNDTHWSSAGYQQVSAYLIKTLQESGVLK